MRIPYGFTLTSSGTLEINRSEANVVRMIFDFYMAGASLGKVVDMLHAKQISSPTGKAKWTRAAVDHLLSNGKYIAVIGMEKFMDARFEKSARCNVDYDSVMLCGRFYMPLLLVTVARGSKVPGAACSPFQSALTNHLLKWRTIMTTINLKRYYPYMTENVMLEVSDEIAAALSMGGRLCDSYKRQKRRNGECSLDTDPGFEADVLRQPMTPDEYIEARETTFALYDALAQLPPTQARRVYQHYLLGMSKAEIAAAEGVGRSRICCSIERGLAAMKNILKKSL